MPARTPTGCTAAPPRTRRRLKPQARKIAPMLERDISDAQAEAQAADVRVEEALDASPERSNLGEELIAAAIAQAGARIAIALLRSAQAFAQNMDDPRR
jgi:hypothetical protein